MLQNYNRKPLHILIAILLIYTIIYIVQARPLHAVQIVDYWLHMDWARALSIANPESLLNGFYPIGYLFLLRLGLELGFDMARYGQFLSWFGSLLCLISVFGILYHPQKKIILATIGVIILIAHPFFRFQAMREGTDMLAVGWQLLGIYLLFINTKPVNKNLLFLSGLAFGFGYLIRYTTLVFIPIAILFILMQERKLNKSIIINGIIFSMGFLLISLPQLTISIYHEGTPFYNEQARNVWFGIYGDFDWTENWSKIPENITLSEIILNDPATFLTHTLSEFTRFLAYSSGKDLDPLGIERHVTLWNPLISHLFWLIACCLILWDKRLKISQRILLLLSLFFPILITSMAWLFNRFLLMALGLQVIIIAFGISHLINHFSPKKYRDVILVAATAVFLVLFFLSTNWTLRRERVLDMNQNVNNMNQLLAQIGIKNTNEVASNNRLYQRLNSPTHPRYQIFDSFNNNPNLSIEELTDLLIGKKENVEFLIFDWSSHSIRTYNLVPYKEKLLEPNQRLTPLVLEEDFYIFCQTPCSTHPR